MKTVHLTNAWHPRSGGIATFYRALLDAAERRQHDIRLIVPSSESRVETVGRHGTIYHLAAPIAPFNPDYRILYPLRSLLPAGDIVRILDRERPDLIEVCDKYTHIYVGSLLRTRRHPLLRFRPAVVGLSCERMDENAAAYLSAGSYLRTLTQLYLRWLYFPSCDHHIAVSEHTASELRAVAAGHKVTRGVWILPMGADTNLFSPSRRQTHTRRHWLSIAGAPPDGFLLLYAGRLAPEKNVGLLADTMKRLPPDRFRLIVAGDGILRKALEKQLADRAVFLGHVSDKSALADLYANCDLFLHPNPAEPFGIAPLEAMASGLTLIAPASGGITAYADHTNSCLVPCHPDAFAGTVLRLAANEPERASLARAAVETARLHDWTSAANRYLDLYTDIAGANAIHSARTAPSFTSSPKHFLQVLFHGPFTGKSSTCKQSHPSMNPDKERT